MDRSVEIRVGIVITVAILLFVAGMIWITETQVRDRGYTIEAAFPTVGGLAPGDPIQVAGVERGRVKGVALRPDDVLVTLWLPSDVRLRQGSLVSVENLGLMGEKFVSIQIGDQPGTVEPGTILDGYYSPGLTETMAQVNRIMVDLQEIVRRMRDTVAGDSSTAGLVQAIRNTNELSTRMLALISRSGPQVEGAVGDFAASARELRALVETNRDKVGASLDGIERTTAGLDSLVAELKTTSVSLRTITSRVEAGEGTLGKLSNDAALYDDLRKTLTSLDALILDLQKNPKKYINLEIF